MENEMSGVQRVSELVLKAREDTGLWEVLKKNERRLQAAAERGDDVHDAAAILGAANLALLSLRITDFLRRHDYDLDKDDEVYHCLIILLRSFVRKELGFPVDIDWDGLKNIH